ncbi:hypothetical protein DL770_001552 [Monosporascus sp. CRB-9-2]|nr:hypothetical protein DL770_001552 [Monosporascus sp. CRB-9-2]
MSNSHVASKKDSKVKNSEDLLVESQQEPTTMDSDGCKDASPSDEPFSIFTEWQKRWISFAASFGALFSTLSSYIYLPALVPMARDLGVTLTLLNLTVTSYLIVAGLAPAFMGDMADQSGRRPVYILMFILMLGANIGMALQNSYPVLLVLRMFQSAGASGKDTHPPVLSGTPWVNKSQVHMEQRMESLQISRKFLSGVLTLGR